MIIMIITVFVCLLYLFRQQNQICTFYCTVFVPLVAQAILVLYVLTDCRKWLCPCVCACVCVCGTKMKPGIERDSQRTRSTPIGQFKSLSYHFIIKDLPHKTFKDQNSGDDMTCLRFANFHVACRYLGQGNNFANTQNPSTLKNKEGLSAEYGLFRCLPLTDCHKEVQSSSVADFSTRQIFIFPSCQCCI